MLTAILALVIFLASHVVLAENPSRAWLIERFGPHAHFISYSILSLILIWWVSVAVAAAPVIVLWAPVAQLRWLPMIVMPVAVLLAVCGVSQSNPSSIVAERMAPAAMTRREPRGILTVTRNPVMWALGLWALSHALASNQLAEILRFGGFAALAILGSYRIEKRVAAKWGDIAWRDFAARTSNLPFAAILQGRIALDWRKIGWLRPLIAAALYVFLFCQHAAWFGLPVFVG